MQQGVQTDATSKNVGSGWPLIRRSLERGFKKEEIAGAAENCQVLETNNKNFLKVEMLSPILKSLISVKVQIAVQESCLVCYDQICISQCSTIPLCVTIQYHTVQTIIDP